jgi:hypothetical protein
MFHLWVLVEEGWWEAIQGKEKRRRISPAPFVI